jgi:glutaminyl-peptide cyclotransferase
MCAFMVAGCGKGEPKPMPESSQQTAQLVRPVQIPSFSGVKAFQLLVQQTKFGPRNPGSPGHATCLEFLNQEMQKYADAVRLQEFTEAGYDNERLRLTNIIASFKPQATERVLLCAHWDTRPRAENDENKSLRDKPILGANDGASGVAILLELASLLKQSPPNIGVDLALWDGEDYGKEGDLDRYLLGSRFFATHKSSDYVPRFGILLDMVGDKYLDIPKEQHSVKYAPDVVDMVWQTAKDLGYPQFIDEPGELMTDDHLPLNEAGIKTIDLIDFDYPDPTNRFWHSHDDVPENCSAESLEAVGTVITHVVYSQLP